MESIRLPKRGWLHGLALTAVALAPLAVGTTPVLAAAQVRVVGCNLASLSPELIAAGLNGVAPIADDGADDGVEEDQQPKIVGSIPKPRGVSEDDSRRLAALNLTTTRDQAIETAMAAVADRTQRTVNKAVVEGENGYVVWAVKTELNNSGSGPDPKLEAKIDAGGDGRVLSIECDLDDD